MTSCLNTLADASFLLRKNVSHSFLRPASLSLLTLPHCQLQPWSCFASKCIHRRCGVMLARRPHPHWGSTGWTFAACLALSQIYFLQTCLCPHHFFFPRLLTWGARTCRGEQQGHLWAMVFPATDLVILLSSWIMSWWIMSWWIMSEAQRISSLVGLSSARFSAWEADPGRRDRLKYLPGVYPRWKMCAARCWEGISKNVGNSSNQRRIIPFIAKIITTSSYGHFRPPLVPVLF